MKFCLLGGEDGWMQSKVFFVAGGFTILVVAVALVSYGIYYVTRK